MTSAIFVNASDLVHWADNRDAQAVLPQLIRRLVHATSRNLRRNEFRSGYGVQLSGWDGIVEVDTATAFIPDGVSAWEMSTDKDIKGKAEDDFAKRRQNPLGLNPSDTTFGFVTPRRWPGKRDWVNAHEEQKTWRAIRVHDADDLEQWLEVAPAVHTWISILLGKRPDSTLDADSCWNDWSEATKPATSSQLVLAGRECVVNRIHGWLVKHAGPLALRGESRTEALGVFLAALQRLPGDKHIDVASRTVIVQRAAAWNALAARSESLILVSDFSAEAPSITNAVRNGHAVVLLLGQADSSHSNTIEIPRLSREEVAKALLAMGISDPKAQRLAGVARRSLTALRRTLSIAPAILQPNWARPENARSLLPALLVGQWNDKNEADRGILATLGRCDYRDIQSTLVRWANEDDPPVRRVGTTWYLTSQQDAWNLLGRFLTSDDLQTFRQVALAVLSVADPAFELPAERRWMAGALGARREHSPRMCKAIGTTLAILGTMEDSDEMPGVELPRRYAASIVGKLLNSAEWKAWASLPLGLLAEAAPDEFLDALDRWWAGDRSGFRAFFSDGNDSFFSSSPHVQLLWALEILAWSQDYFIRAARALARLAQIDPGGRIANRPHATLRSLFLPWLPLTTASVEGRLQVLDLIRKDDSQVAWRLMCELLPQAGDSQMPTSKPHWRDWAPEVAMTVSRVEYIEAVHGTVERMLEDAGVNGERWSDLLRALPRLGADYSLVFSRLNMLDRKFMDLSDISHVWNALRSLISHHRSCPDADWALPKEEVDRLDTLLVRFEPESAIDRYGWLFNSAPTLPEGRNGGWTAYHERIATRQCDAVRDMVNATGLQWIPEFIGMTERPDLVGAALARIQSDEKIMDAILQEYVGSRSPHHRRFIGGLIGRRVHLTGLEWAKQKLAGLGQDWSPAHRAGFCSCMPFEPATWEIVEEMGADVTGQYWMKVVPFYVPMEHLARAVRRLIDHDRPAIAVDLLSLHTEGSNLPADLVADALEQLLKSEHARERNVSAYNISSLLRVVSNSAEVAEDRVVALEWAFLPMLRHEYLPSRLHRELGRSPTFFARIIAIAFHAEGEESREMTTEERARWERAYELLQSFRTLPGTEDNGVVDAVALRAWVVTARELLRADARLSIGDHMIGQMLSGSPGGGDGAWPHPAVRDLIEELSSEQLERGLEIGVLNSEGVTQKNPYDDGDRERRIAETYNRYAEIVRARWGRTAAMLRRLGANYTVRARDEDHGAELRQDLSS